MQAIELAEAIYSAERRGIVPRPRPRQDTYRPLDQLNNLPATPSGFRLQFHTDGMTYSVSLKDTLDGCQYAVFSDQDGYIYEGTPRRAGNHPGVGGLPEPVVGHVRWLVSPRHKVSSLPVPASG